MLEDGELRDILSFKPEETPYPAPAVDETNLTTTKTSANTEVTISCRKPVHNAGDAVKYLPAQLRTDGTNETRKPLTDLKKAPNGMLSGKSTG